MKLVATYTGENGETKTKEFSGTVDPAGFSRRKKDQVIKCVWTDGDRVVRTFDIVNGVARNVKGEQ